jgi:hypothetical protein
MVTRRGSATTLAAGVIPLLAMLAGCGGTKSMASRSAAAYDEALRNGVAVGESAHGAKEGHGGGGHAAEPSPQRETASPAMPGMDHSGKGAKDGRPTAEMDHSKMPGMKPSGTGMDHSKMPGMSHDLPMSPPAPEPLSATAKPGQPAATLQADPLDQPPATSVADAARSATMAKEMSGGGHGMSHGTYQHVDAGRDIEMPSPKPSPQVKEHKQ